MGSVTATSVAITGTVSISGTVATTPGALNQLTDAPEVSILATSGATIPANLSRIQITIGADGNNADVVMIGGTSATTGIPLQPGTWIGFNNTDSINVFNPNATTCIIRYIEQAI